MRLSSVSFWLVSRYCCAANPTVNGTINSTVEHHWVQPTGCMDNETEPSRGVQREGHSRMADQFSLDHAQSCAPGWRCDRVSSEYNLALTKYSDISRYATNPSWLFPACIPTTTSILYTMTIYTHAATVIDSSAFNAQLQVIWGSSSGVCGNSTITTTPSTTTMWVIIIIITFITKY